MDVATLTAETVSVASISSTIDLRGRRNGRRKGDCVEASELKRFPAFAGCEGLSDIPIESFTG